MQVSVEKIDDINIIIRGSIDNSELGETLTRLKKEATPETSDDSIQREAEGQLLHAFIEKGMHDINVSEETLLGQPSFRKYEKHDTGLYLEAEISTHPEIDITIEYMDIVPEYTQPTIDPKEIETKLSEMAIQKAPFTPIKDDRAVKNGDLVVIDFEGFLNGRALEGGSAELYKLKVGSKSFIPGFEEKMLGMKINEEKTIQLTFPKEYQTKALAGQETEFDVKLHEIQEQIPMEINDALAQRIFDDETATLDTLIERMREKMKSQAFSDIYNEQLKPKIIKGLLTKFDFTLPNNVVEQEIDAKINEKAQRMSKEEHALYKTDKEKFAAFRNSLKAEARDSIKAALIVDALAKKENIEVSEEEVLSALSTQAIMTGQDAEEIVAYYKENNLMTSAKVGLIEDKLFSKMLGIEK